MVKKNKKENVQTGEGFEELVNDQQQEIAHLKKSNAALRGLNSKLLKDVEHYKALDKEGDELNERRIAEIERLMDTIKQKDKTIDGLEAQVRGMADSIKSQSSRIETLKGEVGVAEANLEYYKSLPWYKKIFSR